MSIGSFLIGDDDAVQRHIKLEREKGIKLRKTPWWKTQIQSGVCHFCQQQVGAEALTMDHVVPLARGGKSTRGNVVPACQSCNHHKKIGHPGGNHPGSDSRDRCMKPFGQTPHRMTNGPQLQVPAGEEKFFHRKTHDSLTFLGNVRPSRYPSMTLVLY